MKITKEKLNKIIKEEIEAAIEEGALDRIKSFFGAKPAGPGQQEIAAFKNASKKFLGPSGLTLRMILNRDEAPKDFYSIARKKEKEWLKDYENWKATNPGDEESNALVKDIDDRVAHLEAEAERRLKSGRASDNKKAAALRRSARKLNEPKHHLDLDYGYTRQTE